MRKVNIRGGIEDDRECKQVFPSNAGETSEKVDMGQEEQDKTRIRETSRNEK